MHIHYKHFAFLLPLLLPMLATAQCTTWASPSPTTGWIDLTNEFGGAPCDDGSGCAFNEMTAFQVWADEAYQMANIQQGGTYTFSTCNGVGGTAWPLSFTILSPSGNVDAFGLDAGSICAITWTATETGTYLIVITEEGACGNSPNDQVDNGFPAITCLGGTSCGACTTWENPSPTTGWSDFNTDFGGAPCDDGSGCAFNEISTFEVWASEAYAMDNVQQGGIYTFSACNGTGGTAWPLSFTILSPSGNVDASGLDDGSICSLTWTASETGTYLIVVNEAGACGTSSNTAVDNGFPAITCAGGTSCGACTTWENPSPTTGWSDFNTEFGGAPCDDGSGCAFNEITDFEVFASEAYAMDNVQQGGIYTFSACNGTGGTAWPLSFTILSPSGNVDASGLDDGSICSLTWTASESGTYLIVVNEAGECGTSSNTATNNGFPAITCLGGTSCGACTTWENPSPTTGWNDFNTEFSGAPCDDGSGCAFNEITDFEVFASEAYAMDNVQQGGTYTFSACNGTGGTAWPLSFTILSPSGNVDASGLDDGSICSLTWTASESGTYLIVVNEAGECGTSSNTATNNGFPAITCVSAPCGACATWENPTPTTGWVDFNNEFGGAPCDDGSGCPFNEIIDFEVFASEAYAMDDVQQGGTYTFSACNGTGGTAWPLSFTILAPSGAIDANGLDAGSICALTWTASESGTYLIVVNEAGECGTSSNTATNNGFPAITCVSSPETQCLPTGIEAAKGTDISIYPNPSTGLIAVQLPSGMIATSIEVVDAGGRLVQSNPTQGPVSGPVVLDLSGEATGAYHVRVITRDAVHTQRFLLMQY